MHTETTVAIWPALEQIILSGQMSDADLQSRLRDDPEFRAWMQSRASSRARSFEGRNPSVLVLDNPE